MSFVFDPSKYEDMDFPIIPEGDHRIRIEDVTEKTFRSGNDGYELVLSVSGHNSRLWHYLSINNADFDATNKRFGDFFNSFGITDYRLEHYKSWVGKVGAGKVSHEEYEGEKRAKVRYFISRARQDKLPPWKEPGTGFAATSGTAATSAPAPASVPFAELPDDGDLPFN